MTYAMHKLRVILRWSFVYICYSGIINLNEKRYLPTIFGAPNSLPLVPPGREGTLIREHHPLPLDGCPALMVLGKLKTFDLVHLPKQWFSASGSLLETSFGEAQVYSCWTNIKSQVLYDFWHCGPRVSSRYSYDGPVFLLRSRPRSTPVWSVFHTALLFIGLDNPVNCLKRPLHK